MDLIIREMKRLNILAAAAVAVLAVSCAKDNQDINVSSSLPDGFNVMTFKAEAIATRTTFSALQVFWEATDKVSLFSGTEFTKTELSIKEEDGLAEDNSWAKFAGLAADESSEFVAVYPSAETNSYDGTTINVVIPTEQTAVARGFQSGANVTVAWSTDQSLEFKNIGSLIGIRFATASDAAKTRYLTIKAKKSETEYCGLTGNVSVTIDHENMVPVASEGSADYVRILPPAEGFEVATTYYAVVCPGTYKGVDVIYTDINGNDILRSNPQEYFLERNYGMNIGQIAEPYNTLPDEITISLDFTSDINPLGNFKKIADQTTEGDTYKYSYSYLFKGNTIKESFNYVLIKGSARNTTATGYYQHIKPNDTAAAGIATKTLLIVCNSGDTKIKLPGIPGRYLKSVSMSVLNTDNRRFRLQNDTKNRYVSSPWAKATSTTEKATTTVSFPNTATTFPTTTEGVAYTMELTDKANYYITDITAVYTKTAPVDEPANSNNL